MSDLKSQVKSWLEEQFTVDFSTELTGQSDLFDAGVIDSFGQVELVGFLERTFSIHFTDEELMAPEMSSLDGMVALIESKRT